MIEIRCWNPHDKIMYDPMPIVDFALLEINGHKTMLYIGIKDKNNRKIFVGDIVEGGMRWMKGDGYVRKGYPKEIRVWLEVVHGDGRNASVGFHLHEANVHPEDRKAAEKYSYRLCRYHMEEDCAANLVNNEHVWLGKNSTLEVIGNIHQNPELIKQD